MNRIQLIMNNSNMITCKCCGETYLPMSESSENFCPIPNKGGVKCNSDHYGTIRKDLEFWETLSN